MGSRVPHVFPFVLVGDDHIAAAGFEVVDLDDAVSVVLDRESLVNHAANVIPPVNQSKTNHIVVNYITTQKEERAKSKVNYAQHPG